MNERDHHEVVDAWIADQADGLTAVELLPLFEAAVGAVWLRAHRTLGDVTLRAIMERVLHTVTVGHPALSALTLDTGGLRFGGIAPGATGREELLAGIRCLLVEFLTVLGNLTADILTPVLHQDLKAVVAPAEGGRARRAASTPRRLREHKA